MFFFIAQVLQVGNAFIHCEGMNLLADVQTTAALKRMIQNLKNFVAFS